MFFTEILGAYKEYKKNHKDEIMKLKLQKQLVQYPINYVLIEEFMKAMIDLNHKNLSVEFSTKDGGSVKIKWDAEENKIKRITDIEAIMRG